MRRYNVTDAPQHKYSKQIKWFVKGVTLWAGWLCKGEGRSQDVKGLLINPCKGHLCAKPKFKTSVGLITDQWSAHMFPCLVLAKKQWLMYFVSVIQVVFWLSSVWIKKQHLSWKISDFHSQILIAWLFSKKI